MSSPLQNPPQLLVTVLDWGMGHATRTLPLIENAAQEGWHVHVASKGTALAWLESHAKGLNQVTFHRKPGPNITYAKRGNFWRIALQMPAFVAYVERERKWTAEIVNALGIDAIVSDNCYGCTVPDVPSVLMSHQLQIPTPKWLEGSARLMVQRWARAFDEIWVPDVKPGEASLSGALAHAHVHPNTKYIGVLSRLAQHKQPQPATRWARLGMVSGVEPHRTLMEQGLRTWMNGTEEPCLVIAGQPGGGIRVDGHITTWCDPTDEDLATALQEARTVICRSGYSSQLDLAALDVAAILVPTPGQPEQAFLGKLWAERFGFVCLTQKELEQGRIPNQATGALPPCTANADACRHLSAWLGSIRRRTD